MLEIARGLLGLALTLVLSPVVAIVQFFSYFKAKKLKQEIAQLKIHRVEEINHKFYSSKTIRYVRQQEEKLVDNDYYIIKAIPFKKISSKKHPHLYRMKPLARNHIQADVPQNNLESEAKELKLDQQDVENFSSTKICLGLFTDDLRPRSSCTKDPLSAIIEITNENIKGIEALLETNSFHIVDSLKKQKLTHQSLNTKAE